MSVYSSSEFISHVSPHNGEPLVADTPDLLSDGELLWPVVDGIVYLRPRHDLREQAVALLQSDRKQEALIVLLQDQDRFAPLPPPHPHDLQALVADGNTSNLRQAMQQLNYGPVADYFAYRGATPTFLSGLALLQQTVRTEQPVVEVACGIGHFLRVLEAQGIATVGIDVVFSKLWLARRYLGVQGTLVCADIERCPPLTTERPHSVFCHDAFYFFEHKTDALHSLREMASGGNLAIGHVHTDAIDHGVAGYPLSIATYRRMATRGAAFFDDVSLVSAWLEQGQAQPQNNDELEHAEAIAWVEGETNQELFPLTQPVASLSLNPLLEVDEREAAIRWPSERFREEYEAEAAYLQLSSEETALLNSPEQMSEEQKTNLFRRRILLDLPSTW